MIIIHHNTQRGLHSPQYQRSSQYSIMAMGVSKLKDRIVNYVRFLHYSYTLHSAVYMLEAWESLLFHCVLLLILATATYTTYLFLPGHLLMLRGFFNYVVNLGGVVFTSIDAMSVENTAGMTPS